jgi:uncharacterized protein YtpQ (UPF0354 family)
MNLRLLLLVPCLLWMVGCAPKTPEQKFSEGYARSVERNLPGFSARVVGPLEVRIRRPDGQEVTAFLDNAFKEWAVARGDAEPVYAAYRNALASHTLEKPAPLEAAQILPVVKDRQFLNNVRPVAEGAASKVPVHEALNDELFVFYVQDTPTSMRYLHEDELTAVGFNAEVRRAKALENLRSQLPEVSLRGGNGIYMLTAGGIYEASLLLSDRIWTNENLRVHGELIVAVPSRDLVVITGSEDAENLKKVREIVKETSAAGSYLISERLFVRREGGWVIFE